MAAKALGSQQKLVDEVFFRNDAVSLCLLVNRRARVMRVVDFRAGPSPAKRRCVLSLAQREGAEKVITLVERDEVATWTKLGFRKEANIPGFYKRSDAFILGCTVADARASAKGSAASAPSGDDDEVDEPMETDPAVLLVERTLAGAKKILKRDAVAPSAIKLREIREEEARRDAAHASRSGFALTGFEPFGRDAERRYFMATARGFTWVLSTEMQSCFSNAFVEMLTGPKTELEAWMMAAAMGVLCNQLIERGVVGAFAWTPSDDVRFATVFLSQGFRRTGILRDHLLLAGKPGNRRRDAILWSKKLTNPADD